MNDFLQTSQKSETANLKSFDLMSEPARSPDFCFTTVIGDGKGPRELGHQLEDHKLDWLPTTIKSVFSRSLVSGRVLGKAIPTPPT